MGLYATAPTTVEAQDTATHASLVLDGFDKAYYSNCRKTASTIADIAEAPID